MSSELDSQIRVDDGASPWAGDDVPVPPAPTTWPWSGADRPADAPGRPGRSTHDEDPARSARPAGVGRRRRWTIGAALAFAVAIVAIVATNGDPSERVEEPPASIGVDENAPATVAALEDGVVLPVDPTTPASTDVADRGDVRGGDAVSVTDRWSRHLVDLDPAVFASMTSTATLVGVTRAGVFFELELPAGSLATRDLGLSTAEALDVTIDVNRSTAVLSGSGGAPLVVTSGLAPRAADGSWAGIDATTIVDVSARPGRFDFVARLRDSGELVGMGGEGLVTLRPAAPTEEGWTWSGEVSHDGELVWTRPDGLIRIGSDPSDETSFDGELLASSRNHLVARRCTTTGDCSIVVIDELGQELPVDMFGASLPDVIEVSPDGASLRVVLDGGDAHPIEIIVDLATRAANAATVLAGDGSGRRWAPDSSGIVTLDKDGAMYFVDRESQTSVRLPDELLGPVATVSFRPDGRPLSQSASEATP